MLKKKFLLVASMCILTVVLVFHNSVFAISQSQRHIFNMGISYYNECLSSGSGGGVAGDNTDYLGNQIFTDEEMAKIEELRPFYQSAAEEYDVPWQAIAVVHYREHRLGKDGPANGQGPYQEVTGGWPVGPYSDEQFQEATDSAAKFLKSKAGGRDLSDPNNVKYMFFAYNGLASVYIKQALNLGFSEEEAANGEGSPYVMNRADKQRDPTDPETASNNTWGQIKVDNGGIEYPANSDYGAYVMYEALGGNGASSSETKNDGHFIWTGDSRTVGMQNAVSNGDNTWVGKESAGYDWFTSDAIQKVNNELADGDTIVFNFGINDLGNVDKYRDKLNELVEGDWSKAGEVIVMSVNPVNEELASSNGHTVTNARIESFNKSIRNGLSSKIKYVDTYNQIKDQLNTGDGVHYDNETYQKLYDIIRGTGVDSDAICDDTETALSGTINDKIVQIATEWAGWGNTYGTCYSWGGGHGSQEDIDKRIDNHFSGGNEYGVDCSGFASAVIYKATGRWQSWDTQGFCSDTDNFKEVDDPQPGDFQVTCTGHVAVILEVYDDGTYKTAESKGTGGNRGDDSNGCGGAGPNFGNFNKGKTVRYIGSRE